MSLVMAQDILKPNAEQTELMRLGTVAAQLIWGPQWACILLLMLWRVITG